MLYLQIGLMVVRILHQCGISHKLHFIQDIILCTYLPMISKFRQAWQQCCIYCVCTIEYSSSLTGQPNTTLIKTNWPWTTQTSWIHQPIKMMMMMMMLTRMKTFMRRCTWCWWRLQSIHQQWLLDDDSKVDMTQIFPPDSDDAQNQEKLTRRVLIPYQLSLIILEWPIAEQGNGVLIWLCWPILQE